MIFTFGLYGLYWFYQTSAELKQLANDNETSPALLTVLLFIPFGSFYSIYKYSDLFEKAKTQNLNKWILFLLWLFFSPAVWFVVQTDLNQRATQ
jgi:hypothetical protein